MTRDKHDGWPVKRSICLLCQQELKGHGYIIASKNKGLAVKRTRGVRAMHEDCATRWLDENLITAQNAHTVPEIEQARAELEQLLKDLRILERKIWDRESILQFALSDHHHAAKARLKGEVWKKYDRSSVCTGCKQTFKGWGYLSFTRPNEHGAGRRFCFACLERYGELGLHNMQLQEQIKEYVVRHREKEAERLAMEADQRAKQNSHMKPSSPRLRIVVPNITH